jgi:hypothetical protein
MHKRFLLYKNWPTYFDLKGSSSLLYINRIPKIAGKNIEYFLVYMYAVRASVEMLCSGVKITCPILSCAWWMEWI